MKTVTGEPLKVIGSELADADAPVVLNADVLSWFQRRGFTEKESDEWATVIFRDREETFLAFRRSWSYPSLWIKPSLPRCISDFF